MRNTETPPAYSPLTISSRIVPAPCLIFLSKKDTGQILTISKNRKRPNCKAIKYMSALGKKSQVTVIPSTSSITIHCGSWSPKRFWQTSAARHEPNIASMRIGKIKKIGTSYLPRNIRTGRTLKLPMVPGA